MKRVTLPRFLRFFVLGIVSELVRLLVFRSLQSRSTSLANLISVPFGVLAAFFLYSTLVWPDRSGSQIDKFVRFGTCKGLTSAVKWMLLPGWLAAFPCPLYDITHTIIDSVIPTVSILDTLITCEWMSAASMDLGIALILGYYLNNNISFAPRRELGYVSRRRELRRILGGFAITGLVILCILGTRLFGAWGTAIGSISGLVLGAIAGAFYIGTYRPG